MKTETKTSKGADFDRLILGTSSWGNNYGAFNSRGTVMQETLDLLNYAQNKGIAKLDTAPTYGESEKLIGQAAATDFNIYSKLSTESWHLGTDQAHRAVRQSLKNLGIKKFSGLMYHNGRDLIDSRGQATAFMKELMDIGLVDKWGVSVYEVDELQEILDYCTPDFVQLPLNLADQRFADSGMISHLNTAGVEVHGRSIFLQGLLLQDSRGLPRRFQGISKWLSELESFSLLHGFSKLELAISFILSNPGVGGILLGVNSMEHLVSSINAIETSLEVPELNNVPRLENQSLADPRTW